MEATVLEAISTFNVKNMDVNNIYILVYRLCTHGGYQVHGFNYQATHAPVSSNTSLPTFLALSSALNLRISACDVSNAFQSTKFFD